MQTPTKILFHAVTHVKPTIFVIYLLLIPPKADSCLGLLNSVTEKPTICTEFSITTMDEKNSIERVNIPIPNRSGNGGSRVFTLFTKSFLS